MFLGEQVSKFVNKRCLSSFSNQSVLMNHKQRCQQQEITSIRTSNESYVQWKKQFLKNPLEIRIYAEFEAEIEIDKSNIGDKTTICYRQNPVFKGFSRVSQLIDVLRSVYCKYLIGYDNIHCFVDEF